jgi:hypothetical protein
MSKPDFSGKPLDASTWPDFASLAEQHGGVWGGCWCLAFHPERKGRGQNRREKMECRVRDGSAHAAVVYVGELVDRSNFGGVSDFEGPEAAGPGDTGG